MAPRIPESGKGETFLLKTFLLVIVVASRS